MHCDERDEAHRCLELVPHHISDKKKRMPLHIHSYNALPLVATQTDCTRTSPTPNLHFQSGLLLQLACPEGSRTCLLRELCWVDVYLMSMEGEDEDGDGKIRELATVGFLQ